MNGNRERDYDPGASGGTYPDLDQLQPEDTLVDRGTGDVLDEGYSPPDRGRSDRWYREDESIDDRLREEQGDSHPDTLRTGRLVAPDEGSGVDDEADAIGHDSGYDGGAASAEEAAMHYMDSADGSDLEYEDDSQGYDV